MKSLLCECGILTLETTCKDMFFTFVMEQRGSWGFSAITLRLFPHRFIVSHFFLLWCNIFSSLSKPQCWLMMLSDLSCPLFPCVLARLNIQLNLAKEASRAIQHCSCVYVADYILQTNPVVCGCISALPPHLFHHSHLKSYIVHNAPRPTYQQLVFKTV